MILRNLQVQSSPVSATPTTSPLFQGFSSVWISPNCMSIFSCCGCRNIRTIQFILFYHYGVILVSRSILLNYESFVYFQWHGVLYFYKQNIICVYIPDMRLCCWSREEGKNIKAWDVAGITCTEIENIRMNTGGNEDEWYAEILIYVVRRSKPAVRVTIICPFSTSTETLRVCPERSRAWTGNPLSRSSAWAPNPFLSRYSGQHRLQPREMHHHDG